MPALRMLQDQRSKLELVIMLATASDCLSNVDALIIIFQIGCWENPKDKLYY